MLQINNLFLKLFVTNCNYQVSKLRQVSNKGCRYVNPLQCWEKLLEAN